MTMFGLILKNFCYYHNPCFYEIPLFSSIVIYLGVMQKP